MTTLTLVFALPLLAAIALAFVPRNFAVITRARGGWRDVRHNVAGNRCPNEFRMGL